MLTRHNQDNVGVSQDPFPPRGWGLGNRLYMLRADITIDPEIVDVTLSGSRREIIADCPGGRQQDRPVLEQFSQWISMDRWFNGLLQNNYNFKTPNFVGVLIEKVEESTTLFEELRVDQSAQFESAMRWCINYIGCLWHGLYML